MRAISSLPAVCALLLLLLAASSVATMCVDGTVDGGFTWKTLNGKNLWKYKVVKSTATTGVIEAMYQPRLIGVLEEAAQQWDIFKQTLPAARKDNWGDLTCPSGKERGHIIPIRWLATRDQQDCTFVVDNMVCEPGDLNRVGHSALEGAAGLLSLIDPHSWMAVKAGFETNTDGQRIMTSLMMKLLWQMEGDEYELCMKSDRALTQMGACAKSDRSAGTSVSPGVLPVGAPGLKGLEGFVTRRLKGELASLSAFCAEQLKLNTNLAKWLNYFLAPAGNSLKEKLAWCDDNNAEFPDIRFFHQLGLLRALQNADVWKSGGSFIGSADVAAEFLTVKTSQTSLLNEWMEAVTSPQPQPQPAPVGLGRQPKTKVIKKAKKKPRLG